MKLWISILVLTLAVLGICIWDSIYTKRVFNTMEIESNKIYQSLLISNISNENIQKDIINLNEFWTKKMDTLSVSISRKDMMPISDYLQYLYSSIINQNQEDAITYSRLLTYNVTGLKETNFFNFINML